jgi:hypothetical protein
MLKAAEVTLYVQGLFFFIISNRLLKNEGRATAAIGLFHPFPWLRSMPRGSMQLWWFVYCVIGGGFPFCAVRHPMPNATGVFRRYVHPTLYWGLLSVYKVVWSSLQAVKVAAFLTDPRAIHANTHSKWCPWPITKVLPYIQRERILQLQNLRYQHQWSDLQDELSDPLNQLSVKAVRIENRWVAIGPMGAAIQDILDEARELALLRPHQVIFFFNTLGTTFHALTEVSIAMSLPLPVLALKGLLESAPHLEYLRLDGVALSVHDLHSDLLAFGRALHGLLSSTSSSETSFVNNIRPIALKTLSLEQCRLENDEPDPQLRQRYTMDLLLTPVIYAALTVPTRLSLQHLTLWVKCQRISALELAVTLSDNTSLKSLELQLTLDKTPDEEDEDETDEDPAEWVILPLAQVLQHRNSTLTHLSIQLPTGLPINCYSHKALRRMMELNETLHHVHLLQLDRQRRIRIPEVDFYLYLNRLGRQEYRLECASGGGCSNESRQYQTKVLRRWVEILIQERRNTAVVHYFLSLNPSWLLMFTREKDFEFT